LGYAVWQMQVIVDQKATGIQLLYGTHAQTQIISAGFWGKLGSVRVRLRTDQGQLNLVVNLGVEALISEYDVLGLTQGGSKSVRRRAIPRIQPVYARNAVP
jgi:hypothetical protein